MKRAGIVTTVIFFLKLMKRCACGWGRRSMGGSLRTTVAPIKSLAQDKLLTENYHVHCTSSKNDDEMCCPEVCCFRFFAMKATSTTPNLLGLHVPLSQLELPSHQVDDRVSLASSRHFKRPRKTDIIKIKKERKSPTNVVVMNNPHLTS